MLKWGGGRVTQWLECSVHIGEVGGSNPSSSTEFLLYFVVTTRQKRKLFWGVWLFLILSGPVSILRNIPISTVLSDQSLQINFLQRIFGLLAFTLLFIQIMIGAFMKRWVQIIGAKAYKYHITQGLFTYGVVLVHPTLFSILNWKLFGSFKIFLLPSGFYPLDYERFLVPARVAFVLLTIGVAAGYFRTKPFFRRHWRKFHILNYLAFFLIVLHSKAIGSDIATPPFVWVYYFAITAVAITVLYKLGILISEKTILLTKKNPANR